MKLLITIKLYTFLSGGQSKKYLVRLLDNDGSEEFKTTIIHTKDVVKSTINEIKKKYPEVKVGVKDLTV